MTLTLKFDEMGLCEDAALGRWLGLACPTNIRKTIIKHREELDSFGELLEVPTRMDCSADDVSFMLNADHVLVLATISRAPRARMVRAELINSSTVEPSWAG